MRVHGCAGVCVRLGAAGSSFHKATTKTKTKKERTEKRKRKSGEKRKENREREGGKRRAKRGKSKIEGGSLIFR